MYIKGSLLLIVHLLLFTCTPKEDISTTNEIEDIEVVPIEDSFKQNPKPVKEVKVTTLKLGEDAPDFNLPGTDGKFYSLNDFKDAELLAIVFTCNHCPTAQAYEDRFISVVDDYKDKGVAFVAISPNSPLGLLYEELGYSDLNDDFAEMKIRVKDKNYNFPYLYDGDTQQASLKYGPVATPHVFVFNKKRKLVYKGRFDNSEKPGSANAEDLRQSLDELLSGKEVSTPETKTFGCSTKWGWKLSMKERVNEEWAKQEVTLNDIDIDGIKQLIRNNDSDKLRLINVWATWCGPCVVEYPDFIVLQRMYGARDFEFVSISADFLDVKDKAYSFLQKKESAVANYIFSGSNSEEMINAIDKDWEGALPYTMLIEPGGRVVWKHQGEVDFYELKKEIVDHELIGRFY